MYVEYGLRHWIFTVSIVVLIFKVTLLLVYVFVISFGYLCSVSYLTLVYL